MIFFSPTHGKMTLEQVAGDIKDYVAEGVEYQYKLIIGSDSQSRQDTCFITAIILHRVGKGARYYYTRKYERKMTSLRQRIFFETSLSLSMAAKIEECLLSEEQENLKVEIHLDVGTHGETKQLVKEVIRMVIGSGFDAKIKPYACGASKVADRHTK